VADAGELLETFIHSEQDLPFATLSTWNINFPFLIGKNWRCEGVGR